MDVRVTRMTTADAIDAQEVSRLTAEGTGHGEAPIDADRWTTELSRPWAVAWIARSQAGLPLGYLLAWQVEDEVQILDVATHPAARRRGVARTLLTTLVQHAASHHASTLVLEARRSNDPAIALYRSFGFHAAGVRPRYYSDGEAALTMVASIDAARGEAAAQADDPDVQKR